MRAYYDRYLISCNLVEKLDMMKLKDVKVPMPTGMKKTYVDSLKFLDVAYKDLVLGNVPYIMQNHVKEIYDNLMKAYSDKDRLRSLNVKEFDKYYTKINKVLLGIVNNHLKINDGVSNDPSVKTKDEKFSKLFKKVSEIKEVREGLLDHEDEYVSAFKAAKISEDLSEKLHRIIETINTADTEPPKVFIEGLLQLVKTQAIYFETVGTVITTQMVMEHNLILMYHKLDEFIKAEDA